VPIPQGAAVLTYPLILDFLRTRQPSAHRQMSKSERDGRDLTALAQARLGAAARGAVWGRGVARLMGEGHRIVQQGSTATGPDAGTGCTLRDGDLRLHTLVDGLPLDGMQEVRSSNLLSSTQFKSIIRTVNRGVARF
jgi:hypothetical protein